MGIRVIPAPDYEDLTILLQRASIARNRVNGLVMNRVRLLENLLLANVFRFKFMAKIGMETD